LILVGVAHGGKVARFVCHRRRADCRNLRAVET
jgi:hypothetical protein